MIDLQQSVDNISAVTSEGVARLRHHMADENIPLFVRFNAFIKYAPILLPRRDYLPRGQHLRAFIEDHDLYPYDRHMTMDFSDIFEEYYCGSTTDNQWYAEALEKFETLDEVLVREVITGEFGGYTNDW